jgi:ribosomal protein L32
MDQLKNMMDFVNAGIIHRTDARRLQSFLVQWSSIPLHYRNIDIDLPSGEHAIYTVDNTGELLFKFTKPACTVFRLNSVVKVCSNCGTRDLRHTWCQCKASAYCDRQCQKQDWQHHKTWCKQVQQLPDHHIVRADRYETSLKSSPKWRKMLKAVK